VTNARLTGLSPSSKTASRGYPQAPEPSLYAQKLAYDEVRNHADKRHEGLPYSSGQKMPIRAHRSRTASSYVVFAATIRLHASFRRLATCLYAESCLQISENNPTASFG
jgi:hypothetical protein